MVGISCSYKTIVLNIGSIKTMMKRLRHLVTKLTRSLSFCLCSFLHFQTMLISTCCKHDLLVRRAMPSCCGVSKKSRMKMSNVWLCVDVENWCCNEKMRSAACSFGGEITAKLVEEWCGSGVHRRLGRIRVPNTRDYR